MHAETILTVNRRECCGNPAITAWAPWENQSFYSAAMNPEFLFQSQIAQNFGILFFHRQQIVAGGTVVRNGLAIGADVATVMTPETAGKIVMPEVVRVYTPGHLHRRENVSQVDASHALRGLFDESTP